MSRFEKRMYREREMAEKAKQRQIERYNKDIAPMVHAKQLGVAWRHTQFASIPAFLPPFLTEVHVQLQHKKQTEGFVRLLTHVRRAHLEIKSCKNIDVYHMVHAEELTFVGRVKPDGLDTLPRLKKLTMQGGCVYGDFKNLDSIRLHGLCTSMCGSFTATNVREVVVWGEKLELELGRLHCVDSLTLGMFIGFSHDLKLGKFSAVGECHVLRGFPLPLRAIKGVRRLVLHGLMSGAELRKQLPSLSSIPTIVCLASDGGTWCNTPRRAREDDAAAAKHK